MSELPETLPVNPLPLFRSWFDEAIATGKLKTPDAMALATANSENRVASRVVLCKDIVVDPGYLVFYSNYQSAKGQQIAANSNVAAVFYWDTLDRQVRIEGIAMQSPVAESDQYFATRDTESRIGAWTSAQSQPIESHAALHEKHHLTQTRLLQTLQTDSAGDVPRPAHWGGYRIGIAAIELWSRGEARLHDRARWERSLSIDNGQFRTGTWTVLRLQP